MLSIFPSFKTSHTIFFLIFIICSGTFAQWDKYPTYDEYINIMNKFETDYPNICKIEEIGESVQGRKLLVAKITDNVDTNEAEPGVFYISTIHGDELCGYVLMLHLIDSMLTGYANSSRIKNLVDNIEIWICPLANPDGTYSGGNNTVVGAKGGNANDEDLSRNFPDVTGTVPPAEKETQAIMNFLSTHDIVISAILHGGAEIALYPWAYDSTNHADQNWFELVTKEYADTAQANSPDGYFEDMGGYSNHYQWYQLYSTFIDYATYFVHCRSIRIELSSQKLLSESELLNHWNYNYRSFFNYMEQVFYGFKGNVIDWYTGLPLNERVKVFIESHDHDSSFIRSKLPHGDFYRLIYPGKYTLSFKGTGYYLATLNNIQLREDEIIRLQVKLWDGMTGDPPLSLASPNGGEVWERGKSYNIIWYYRSANLIQIIKDSVVVDSISLPNATEDSYLWNIPSDLPVGNDYRIRVNGYGSAISDSTFSIIMQTTPIENQVIKPITPDKNFIVYYNQRNISIRYTIPYSTSVKLEAYDIKGKLVKVITDKFMHKGSYSVNWDSKRFGSGVYYLKLSTGDRSVISKAVILK